MVIHLHITYLLTYTLDTRDPIGSKKNEINLFKYQPEVIKLASGVQINLHICLENVML